MQQAVHNFDGDLDATLRLVNTIHYRCLMVRQKLEERLLGATVAQVWRQVTQSPAAYRAALVPHLQAMLRQCGEVWESVGSAFRAGDAGLLVAAGVARLVCGVWIKLLE